MQPINPHPTHPYPNPGSASYNTVSNIVEKLAKVRINNSKRRFGLVERLWLLVKAPAGTGKTWTVWQCAHSVATKNIPVFVIFVQKLANLLRKLGGAEIKATFTFFVEYYINQTVKSLVARKFLLQSLRMRNLVIIVDGIDEAADMVEYMVNALFLLYEQGQSCIVTSRPEAVSNHLERFTKPDIDIITLKQLTEQQQTKAIKSQLKDNIFYQKVCAFSELRRILDAIFGQYSPKDKEAIGKITPEDLLNVTGTETPNPKMRQYNALGQLLAFSDGKAPKSKHLKALKSEETENLVFMINEFLDNSSELLKKLSKNGEESNAFIGSICTKLQDFQKQRQVNKREAVWNVWEECLANTDELFVVAERVLGPIKQGVEELCREFKMDPAKCLRFGPLKHPVRVLFKAWGDYATRFSDEVPVTACVMDIVRCQILCPTLTELVQLLNYIIDTPPAWLTVIRAKNKFIQLTATHFRHLLLNMRASCCGSCGALWNGGCNCASAVETVHFFEIQLHLEQIFLAEDKGPTGNAEHYGHELYEYFRVISGLDVGDQLDFLLEKQMALLAVIGGTPVLLSLLIVVLGRPDHKLPTSLYELYEMAIESSIKKFVDGHPGLNIKEEEVHQQVRQLAYACHADQDEKNRVRVFTHDMANKASSMWEEICGTGNTAVVLSIVKVIEQKASYQFSHLSFQEFLFVDQLLKKWRIFREDKGKAKF